LGADAAENGSGYVSRGDLFVADADGTHRSLLVANATAFSFWVALPAAHPLLERLALGPRALVQP